MLEVYTLSMLVSIASYTLITCITPGPNNFILLSSIVTFGYKRTLPFMIATILSFPLMVVVAGLGVGTIFENFPMLFIFLKIAGVSYLCWMAYKIATDKNEVAMQNDKKSKPFSFLQGFLYPWINVKAWIISISSVAIFVTSGEDRFFQIAIVCFFFLLSTIITINSWAFGGMILQRFISNSRFIRGLNIFMAVLLVVSVVPFMFE